MINGLKCLNKRHAEQRHAFYISGFIFDFSSQVALLKKDEKEEQQHQVVGTLLEVLKN